MATLDTYNKSAAAKNAAAYQNLSLADIGKKYGFNFSRDYANQQAGVQASGQINAQNAARRENESAHKLTSQRILDDYRSSASSLDKGYFQQYLGQTQGQVNRGLNGGLVMDQNLRLAMNKQAELADLFRTRNQANQEENMRYNNTSQTIAEALAQIEKERSANSEKMYQDGLYRGYDVLSSDRSYGLQLDNSAWSKYMDGLNYDQRLKEYAASQARGSGGGGGGSSSRSRSSRSSSGGTSVKKTSLTPAYNSYSTAKKSQAQTNIEKYYTSPAVVAGQRTGSKYFSNPVAPAQNPNLSAWDKMKLLGL